MHDLLLARAARPAPAIVLGLLMRPFSIGHHLLLIREGNPLAESNEASALKVAEAALICAQTWEENARVLFDPLFGLKIKLWGWRIRNRKGNFSDVLDFIAYRNAGSLELPLSDWPWPGRTKDNSARPQGTPFALRLQQFLMTTFGLSENAAWNYPLGLAKMRWQAYWEDQGGLDVHNHIDQERDDFISKQEAKGKELCSAS